MALFSWYKNNLDADKQPLEIQEQDSPNQAMWPTASVRNVPRIEVKKLHSSKQTSLIERRIDILKRT
ncbi:hypothetical protein [Colwellia sp. MEBiC06753]